MRARRSRLEHRKVQTLRQSRCYTEFERCRVLKLMVRESPSSTQGRSELFDNKEVPRHKKIVVDSYRSDSGHSGQRTH